MLRLILQLLLAVTSTAVMAAGTLVIAPHPDDDVLTAAGVSVRARLAGEQVTVVYMTNGDLSGGVALGTTRQKEAVNGQVGYLSAAESDLIFLGYPDGGLETMYQSYTAASSSFAAPQGTSYTYASRGLGGVDYHTYRFGQPASYNLPNIVADLSDIISSRRPSQIYTTSEFDQHPDHSTTYQILKLALAPVLAADPSYRPIVNKTIVWSVDTSVWPGAINPTAYLSPIPGLTATPLIWNNRESLDVPLPMQQTNLAVNLKYEAIQAHATQLTQSGFAAFLLGFVHKDEVFWAEDSRGINSPPVVSAGSDLGAPAGQLAHLSGSASFDPDGRPLGYNWRQMSGNPVSLAAANTVSPYFTIPSAAAPSQSFVFALQVSDGIFTSTSDEVTVAVTAPNGASPPIAKAGVAQTVAAGAAVMLDGSKSSDPQNWPLTYLWTQTAGPAVTLVNATSASPSFTAPTGLSSNATLTFQLVVNDGAASSPPASVSVTVTAAGGTSSSNIAPLASVTASSENASTGQLAIKAVDGVIAGYPGDYTKEWATLAEKAGAWLKLAFRSAYTVDHVVLYDRPNLNDQVAGGTLTFSDGSVVAFGALDNAGGATTVQFSPRATTSIRMTVTSVSSKTANVGLAEMQVYGYSSGQTPLPPVANAGAAQTVAAGAAVKLDGSKSSDPQNLPLTYLWTQAAGPAVTLVNATSASPSFTAPTGLSSNATLTFQLVVNDGAASSPPASVSVTVTAVVVQTLPPVANAGAAQTVAAGAAVKLDGSKSSDPQNWPLTYLWAQTAGPAVTLANATSASPSFTAPTGLSSNATLTFQLVVNDGAASSPPASVSVTVTAAGGTSSSNIAPLASVTASSENASTGQLAIKAVDGVIAGYPGDYTKEWATLAEKAGAWLKLAFRSAYTVDHVVLYDRPNLNDQVAGGTLTFSDGSVVAFGALDNAGGATTVQFSPRATTSIRMTVTSVSSKTANVGLAEMQVYGY